MLVVVLTHTPNSSPVEYYSILVGAVSNYQHNRLRIAQNRKSSLRVRHGTQLQDFRFVVRANLDTVKLDTKGGSDQRRSMRTICGLHSATDEMVISDGGAWSRNVTGGGAACAPAKMSESMNIIAPVISNQKRLRLRSPYRGCSYHIPATLHPCRAHTWSSGSRRPFVEFDRRRSNRPSRESYDLA